MDEIQISVISESSYPFNRNPSKHTKDSHHGIHDNNHSFIAIDRNIDLDKNEEEEECKENNYLDEI